MRHSIKISLHCNTIKITDEDHKTSKHNLYGVLETLVEFKPIRKKWSMEDSKGVYDQVLKYLFYYKVHYWLEDGFKQSHVDEMTKKLEIVQEFLMSHRQVLDLMYDFIVKSNKKYTKFEYVVENFIETHYSDN